MGLQKSVEKRAKRKGFERCWHIYYWQLQKSWCCCQDLKWKFWNRPISVYTTPTLAFRKGLWRSAIINKQCFWKTCNSCCVGFKFWVEILVPWRRKEGRVSVSVSVSVSLCLSFDVAMSFRENEKSVAKSLSHVKICTQQHCKIQTNDGFTLVVVPALVLKH